jgi:hypothetical protein
LPKTVTKTPTRTKGGRGAARRPVAKPRRELPIMPLAVGGIFLVVFVVLVVLYRMNATPLSGQPVANIRCDNSEQLAVHYHAHIDLIYKGQPATIPAQTGITGSCFYWMHTHQTTGIVHIEAPKDSASRQFTLGDFFAVWKQPLDHQQVATFKLKSGDQVKVWVDGKPYTGDPSRVVLKSHTQVVVEIGPEFVDPPTFDWTSSAATQEAGTGG